MAFSNYWPLSFTLILMAGFGAWVFIHSNRSYLLRWIIVPLSLCVSVVSAKVYDAALGYALQGDLPAKFLYLGHHVVVEQNHFGGRESGGQPLYESRIVLPSEINPKI